MITKIILMGKYKGEVMQVSYNCKKKKFAQKKTLWGCEYDDKATTGWKTGKVGKPKIRLD